MAGNGGAKVDRLIVNTEDGITRMMDSINSGGKLSWQQPLTKITQQQPEPEPTHHACLCYRSGGRVNSTRIFAKKEVVLGRHLFADADLWLALFPIDDEKNIETIKRMSRCHATIRHHLDRFEIWDNSAWGTLVNDKELSDSWIELSDGDLIQLQRSKALTLQVRRLGEHALLLERSDNGEKIENYLILAPETEGLMTMDENPINLNLAHKHGGIVLQTAQGARINSKSSPNERVGLHTADRIQMGDSLMEYHAQPYPDVSF